MASRLILVIQQLELRFWYFFISLLDESELASYFLQEVYVLFAERAWMKFLKKSAFSLTFGLLLGLLVALYRQLFS